MADRWRNIYEFINLDGPLAGLEQRILKIVQDTIEKDKDTNSPEVTEWIGRVYFFDSIIIEVPDHSGSSLCIKIQYLESPTEIKEQENREKEYAARLKTVTDKRKAAQKKNERATFERLKKKFEGGKNQSS